MGGAVSRRRGRAWLYGLMLPKIQTDMLGTIPLRITWYMCAETYFPTLFLGKHTCCVIPLMENPFLGAAGAFFEGSVPPFGCIWLWAMCQTGCTSHSHCTCLACLCVSSCACVCVTLAAHRCFLWSSSSFPSCVRVFIRLSLFLFLFISPSITITPSPSLISQSVTLVALNFPCVACCCCAHVAAGRGAEGQS